MIDEINEPEIAGPEGTLVETIEEKPVMTDAQLRSRQAAEEIRIILEAYDSELFPVMMLSPKGVIGVSIDIIPKAKKPVPLSGPTAVDTVEPEAKTGADIIPLNAKDGEADLADQVSPDKA